MTLKDIKPLSQRNPRWANTVLGFNTDTQYTIGGYGCLITCLSMITQDAVDFMNVRLKDIDGFANGGYYVWGSVSKLYDDIKELVTITPNSLTNAQVQKIRDSLDAGYPVMFQIDMKPETAVTDMHYVLCIGYDPLDDNGYTILDPWYGDKRELKSYIHDYRRSARSLVEQFIIYESKRYRPEVENDSGGIVGSQEDKIKELEEELDKMRDSRNAWKSKCNEYELEVANLDKHIETLNNQIITLKKAVALNNPELNEYSARELIIELFSRLGISSAKKEGD